MKHTTKTLANLYDQLEIKQKIIDELLEASKCVVDDVSKFGAVLSTKGYNKLCNAIAKAEIINCLTEET